MRGSTPSVVLSATTTPYARSRTASTRPIPPAPSSPTRSKRARSCADGVSTGGPGSRLIVRKGGCTSREYATFRSRRHACPPLRPVEHVDGAHVRGRAVVVGPLGGGEAFVAEAEEVARRH